MTSPEDNRLPDLSHPSLLDGVFSVEFSDCSIAAADLCRAAGELAWHTEQRRKVYITGADGLHTLAWTTLGAKRDNPQFTLNGYNANLVLVQQVATKRIPTQEAEIARQQRRSLSAVVMRKEATPVPQRPTLTEVRSGDPFLAVHFCDTLLPLASFARREDQGICSYVQLGPEMEDATIKDDDLYVTTADDATPRLKVIEALRVLISDTASGAYSPTFQTDEIATIQALLDRQAVIRQESLARAYEAQLVRICYERVKQGKALRLYVLGKDGLITPDDYQTVTILPPVVQEDARLVSLIMAQAVGGESSEDHLKLFAVTRGDIAVSVARLSSAFGAVEFTHEDQLSADSRGVLVRDLLYAITDRAHVDRIEVDDSLYVQPEQTTYDMLIKDTLVGGGRIRASARFQHFNSSAERAHSIDWISGRHRQTAQAILRDLDRYFAYPDMQLPAEIADSAPVKVAAQKLDILHGRDRELLARLPISDMFANHLGVARPCDEVLMHYITSAIISGGELKAKITNQQIGRTKADATLSVKVRRQGTVYNLEVFGRPEAMDHEAMRRLLQVTLDASQPNLGGGTFLDKPDDVEEVTKILQTVLLAPTKNVRQH